MGTSVTALGFAFDWLILDIIPHEQRLWRPMNWQLCDPVRPTTIVSGGPGRRRWEFMRLPGESIEELNTAETAWQLLEPWGMTPDNATLERHVVYHFQARWADSWRQGRLLLAAVRRSGNVLRVARRYESSLEAGSRSRRKGVRCNLGHVRVRAALQRPSFHRLLR